MSLRLGKEPQAQELQAASRNWERQGDDILVFNPIRPISDFQNYSKINVCYFYVTECVVFNTTIRH